MAIRRVSANVPVPVQQAGLIDPSGFRFSAAEARALGNIGNVLEELGKRKIQMQDTIANSQINSSLKDAEREYQKEIIGKPREQHAAILLKHINKAKTFASRQRMSAQTREFSLAKVDSWANEQADLQQLVELEGLQKDATVAVTTDYERALTEGAPQDIIEAELALDTQYAITYLPGEAKALKIKVEKRAVVAMERNAVNAVHDAIEVASNPQTGTGNFEIAKQLARSPSISGRSATAVRSAITTAEKALSTSRKNAQKAAIDEVTSTTIRQYFAGEITVTELNKRHESGLLKDSEFKSMMKGLTETIPEHSDPFAAQEIRRNKVNLKLGAINRDEANRVATEHYLKLDGSDRSKVFSDLEEVEEKVFAAVESNAFSEGKRLMSKRFVGVKSEEDLIDLFGTGLSDAEKKRINRLWTAEVANRDLYERAVEDRLKEMRQVGISDTQRLSLETLRVLQRYQRRKSLELEDLELEVLAEERQLLGSGFGRIAVPRKTLVDVDKLNEAELRAEKARIRELRKSK